MGYCLCSYSIQVAVIIQPPDPDASLTMIQISRGMPAPANGGHRLLDLGFILSGLGRQFTAGQD